MNDREKINKIWDVIALAKYLGDIRPRSWHNLIHEIAEIIDENYIQKNDRIYRLDGYKSCYNCHWKCDDVLEYCDDILDEPCHEYIDCNRLKMLLKDIE